MCERMLAPAVAEFNRPGAYNPRMVSEKPRRFVIQHHELSASAHWDLMLEQDDALATWQVPVPPSQYCQGPVPARRIADHRKAYLDYEGPVSGDRGTVRIADAGTYVARVAGPARWEIELRGRVVRGRFELRPTAPGGDQWELRPLDPL